MDYAIFKTGGKQYRVKPGDVIDVEKLPADEGSTVELADVLAVSRDGELTFGNSPDRTSQRSWPGAGSA